jgi:hypothetical protein
MIKLEANKVQHKKNANFPMPFPSRETNYNFSKPLLLELFLSVLCCQVVENSSL